MDFSAITYYWQYVNYLILNELFNKVHNLILKEQH